jgi:hypothetical protein
VTKWTRAISRNLDECNQRAQCAARLTFSTLSRDHHGCIKAYETSERAGSDRLVTAISQRIADDLFESGIYLPVDASLVSAATSLFGR